MRLIILIIFYMALFSISCSSIKYPVTIQSSLDLPEVSSGSGLAIAENRTFIVGDDSPFLYELDRQHALVNKHLLLEDMPAEGRIPKSLKPDFECMAEEQTALGTKLWIFGSGSKMPERNLLLIYEPAAPENIQRYVISDLYEKIIALAGIKREQLNLEAAVILHQKLYLFNRGTNQLIILPLSSLKTYLQTQASQALSEPEIEIIDLKLAVIGHMQSRFSGACVLPGTSLILFAATLEDTDNWIDDGEILGSMIGILDTQQPSSFSGQHMALVKTPDGQTALEKIESIGYYGRDRQGLLQLLAVADNDDGTSRLFILQLGKDFLPK